MGGFQAAFSSATALLRERARRDTAGLLRTAMPWKLLWREGAEQRGAAVSIIAAMTAVSNVSLCVSGTIADDCCSVARKARIPTYL